MFFHNKYKLVFAAVALMGQTACGSIDNTREPVGVGRGSNEFPQSKCACKEIKQAPVTPELMRRLEQTPEILI